MLGPPALPVYTILPYLLFPYRKFPYGYVQAATRRGPSHHEGFSMRFVLIIIAALGLAGCASFSGLGGQFSTVETVTLAKPATNFEQGVIAVGERLGYQYTGGDRSNNIVRLADQPNFGQSMIGRSFTVQMTLTLENGGRTITIDYVSAGDRSAGARKSQERMRELRAALQSQFGG